MHTQPAFELKTFSSPLLMLDLYRRLQQCVAGQAPAWRWGRSRRLRSTLTARQQQQRLRLQATPVMLRHVAVDVIPTAPVSAPRVRH